MVIVCVAHLICGVGGGQFHTTSIIINEHHQISNESVVVEIIDELWEGGMSTPSHSQMGCKKGKGSFI